MGWRRVWCGEPAPAAFPIIRSPGGGISCVDEGWDGGVGSSYRVVSVRLNEMEGEMCVHLQVVQERSNGSFTTNFIPQVIGSI